ncbi:MAG: UDP-N-acetylmuramoyl-L-alanyl-D-glutamate--2,6-diaminopimelate ligase [Propionibacteriaceae bacterium]|nr:UDP-N-acetylmuramoyl-L-alanyl-D-glutamate--2,6-diaminopimelate ligase [Propionibacteriaceae bacterium]
MTITLAALTQGLSSEFLLGDPQALIDDIVYDSTQAAPGKLFVALPGRHVDGHLFIADAYARGVRQFVVQRWPDDPGIGTDVDVVRVDNAHHALALMSQRFFDFPDRKMTVVAITGTKGKTTVSYMIKAICEAAGKKVGLIGSTGAYYGSTFVKLHNTTPQSYELHHMMAGMVKEGVDIAILEASSQGFAMHRTDGIQVDVGVYTNIARDHISATEHANFTEYFMCKKRIFAQSDIVVVNRDAALYSQIVSGVICPIRTYGFATPSTYHGETTNVSYDSDTFQTTFTCRTPTATGEFTIHMPGSYNISNALAAIAVADILGLPFSASQSGLANARVPGRTEMLDIPAPYTILIDFAHNQISLAALFEAVKAYSPRRILTVFGLEGDRSSVRRFDCGEILARESSYTILADASPRSDDPDQIIADVATGIERAGGQGKYEVIRDRHEAIPAMLRLAEPHDLVLLVGKGSVTWEEIWGVDHPMDERDIVRDYFAHDPGANETGVSVEPGVSVSPQPS